MALAIFRSMLINGPEPDAFTCSATISACETAGMWQLALTLLNNMSHCYLEANWICFSAAISACRIPGEWQLACHLLQQISLRLLLCDDISCTAAIGTCGQSSQWQHALDLVPHFLTEFTFGAAIGACVKGQTAIQEKIQSIFWFFKTYFALKMYIAHWLITMMIDAPFYMHVLCLSVSSWIQWNTMQLETVNQIVWFFQATDLLGIQIYRSLLQSGSDPDVPYLTLSIWSCWAAPRWGRCHTAPRLREPLAPLQPDRPLLEAHRRMTSNYCMSIAN